MADESYDSPEFPVEEGQGKQQNVMGLTGFIVSLVGLILTCGILCPVGLILSLIGIFRQPRGFAVAGTVIGAGGSLVAVFFGLGLAIAILFGTNMIKSIQVMTEAAEEVEAYQEEKGSLPDDVTGQGLMKNEQDAWGTEIRYRRVSEDKFEIRSAGMDGEFGTGDDLPINSSHPELKFGPRS